MESFLNLNQQTMLATAVSFNKRKYSLLTKEARLRNLRIETGKLIEKYFFQVCQELNLNLLIECGAHDGSISIKFCNENVKNHAISFEANPHVVQRFAPSIKSDRIQYLNKGLAREPGLLELRIPSHTAKSWTPQASFDKSLEFDEFEKVKVEVDSLDNLLSELNGPMRNDTSAALWIDGEGFGWEVLNGAKKILATQVYKVIFIEVQDKSIWENEKNASEISAFLFEFGYFPIVRDCPLTSLYNIVFVKSEEISEIIELTNNYWFDFSNIDVGFYEKKDLRFWLSKFKFILLARIPSKYRIQGEKFFAFLGSKSSKDNIAV